MSEVTTNFVIEAPAKLHLRPSGDLVTYFSRLLKENPTLRACLKLASIDPGFNPVRDGKTCDDPTSMTKVMLFTGMALRGWDTENRFQVELSGPVDDLQTVAQKVQSELEELVRTWTNYTTWNRTMDD